MAIWIGRARDWILEMRNARLIFPTPAIENSVKILVISDPSSFLNSAFTLSRLICTRIQAEMTLPIQKNQTVQSRTPRYRTHLRRSYVARCGIFLTSPSDRSPSFLYSPLFARHYPG